MESLSGVKGDNSVKIIGPELDELEKLAEQVKSALETVQGHGERGRVPRSRGSRTWNFTIDRKKCQNMERQRGRHGERHRQRGRRAGVVRTMVEGEKSFDISLALAGSSCAATSKRFSTFPMEVANNTVTPAPRPGTPQTPRRWTERRRQADRARNMPMPPFTGQRLQRRAVNNLTTRAAAAGCANW